MPFYSQQVAPSAGLRSKVLRVRSSVPARYTGVGEFDSVIGISNGASGNGYDFSLVASDRDRIYVEPGTGSRSTVVFEYSIGVSTPSSLCAALLPYTVPATSLTVFALAAGGTTPITSQEVSPTPFAGGVDGNIGSDIKISIDFPGGPFPDGASVSSRQIHIESQFVSIGAASSLLLTLGNSDTEAWLGGDGLDVLPLPAGNLPWEFFNTSAAYLGTSATPFCGGSAAVATLLAKGGTLGDFIQGDMTITFNYV